MLTQETFVCDTGVCLRGKPIGASAIQRTQPERPWGLLGALGLLLLGGAALVYRGSR